MNFSPDQQNAVDAVGRWLKTTEQTFVLDGLAGTGKTTILKYVAELACNVRCATPTGKAAAVLASKLDGMAVEVGTLHSVLYQPIEYTELDLAQAKIELAALLSAGRDAALARWRVRHIRTALEKGNCDFRPRDEAKSLPFVIVDECGMVDEKIEKDLLAVAGKVLFVGDGGQLSSVQGTGFFQRHRADATLQNIHRQAADSAILRYAHAIRNGERFNGWNDTDCVRAKAGDASALFAADQVITGRNNTRRELNQTIREDKGFSGLLPNDGERIVCLKNEHGRGLINGVQGFAASTPKTDENGSLRVDVAYEDRHFEKLKIDPYHFDLYAQPSLTRRDRPPVSGATQWDLGHAMTVHKSQGSEWDHVAVFDDKMRTQDRENRKRWIYTAVTRAAKKLTWIDA